MPKDFKHLTAPKRISDYLEPATKDVDLTIDQKIAMSTAISLKHIADWLEGNALSRIINQIAGNHNEELRK